MMSICFLLLFASGLQAQTKQLVVANTSNLGPALSIPNDSAYFAGSMNTHVSSQETILSHKGYQYVAYYNERRRVVVARRNLGNSGKWQHAVLEDYVQRDNDRHNHISMGICPLDGTIHLAFDHHFDTLHYRVSGLGVAGEPEKHPWDAGVFGEVRNQLLRGKVEAKVTYPAFVQTANGNLNLIFRRGWSANGNTIIAEYNGETHLWNGIHKFIDAKGKYKDPCDSMPSFSRNAYPFDFVCDGAGTLHAAWVWREQHDTTFYNHGIAYARSPDNGCSWVNNGGETVANCLESPPMHINLNRPGIGVFDADACYGLHNGGGMATDHMDQPHFVVKQRNQPAGFDTDEPFANSGNYQHYWRDPEGGWHRQMIPYWGGRTKIYSDASGNLFLLFVAGDPETDSEKEVVHILHAEAAENWVDWRLLYKGDRNCKRNELHADRERLKSEGILSIVSHEFDGKTTDGALYVTDLLPLKGD